MLAKGVSGDKNCMVAGDYDEHDLAAGFMLIFGYDSPSTQITRTLTPQAAYTMQRALTKYVESLEKAGLTPVFWVKRVGLPEDGAMLGFAGDLS